MWAAWMDQQILDMDRGRGNKARLSDKWCWGAGGIQEEDAGENRKNWRKKMEKETIDGFNTVTCLTTYGLTDEKKGGMSITRYF